MVTALFTADMQAKQTFLPSSTMREKITHVQCIVEDHPARLGPPALQRLHVGLIAGGLGGVLLSSGLGDGGSKADQTIAEGCAILERRANA